MHKIIEVATQITETEAASILLLDTKTGDLRFEAATGAKRAEVRSIVVPLEGSIAGWIVSHSQPLVANDVRRDLRYYAQADRVTQFDTRSLLGVPLRTKETTIGALEVLNKRGSSAFGPQDIEMLETLAAQAAVAITNARLFAQNDQLADVVHELRTPMTSIVGYSKMLLTSEGLAPATQKSFPGNHHPPRGRPPGADSQRIPRPDTAGKRARPLAAGTGEHGTARPRVGYADVAGGQTLAAWKYTCMPTIIFPSRRATGRV